jgi:hypothetical protein
MEAGSRLAKMSQLGGPRLEERYARKELISAVPYFAFLRSYFSTY